MLESFGGICRGKNLFQIIGIFLRMLVMGTKEFELTLLALLSALLCAAASYYGDLLATGVFAALTCASGVVAVVLRRTT